MPIKFVCSSCGQRLKVASHKAGQTSVCPKCQNAITIPSVDSEPSPEPEASSPPRQSSVDLPYDVAPPPVAGDTFRFDFDDRIEVVVEDSASRKYALSRQRDEPGTIDLDQIALPRYVIFTQGAMLAVIGITCFLLGMAVGGAVTQFDSGNVPVAQPVMLTGTVSVVSEGERLPDAGAVLIFLPEATVPDDKITLNGLRPGDDPVQGNQPREVIKTWGGSVVRCDKRGQYQTQVPDRGKYFVLAISGTATGRGKKTPGPQEIAQMGRFFDSREDSLEDRRIQWRSETLRGNRKLNVDFD